MTATTSGHVLVDVLAARLSQAAVSGAGPALDRVARTVARLDVERSAQTVATAYDSIARRIGVITADEAARARALIAQAMEQARTQATTPPSLAQLDLLERVAEAVGEIWEPTTGAPLNIRLVAARQAWQDWKDTSR